MDIEQNNQSKQKLKAKFEELYKAFNDNFDTSEEMEYYLISSKYLEDW